MFMLEAAARVAIREGVESCARYSGGRAFEGHLACPKKMAWGSTKSAVRLQKRLALLGTAISAFLSGPAFAQVQLPAVNLGQTSFEDGFAAPGWLLEETPTYYDANTLKDSKGNTIPGSNHLRIFSTTTHIAYLSEMRVMGGRLAFEALQPWVDVSAGVPGGASSTARGLADLIVGIGVQWAPEKIGPGVFAHRFMLDVGMPTGQYSDRQPVNTGNNFVVVNPYYAMTYEVDKWEVSTRLHYLWSAVNNDPFIGLGAISVQPGQAFHMNYAISYEVTSGIRVGFNGYWLKQLTDAKLNGNSIENSRESIVGLGVGVQVLLGENTWLHLNGYKETDARNRAEGTSVILRLSKAIPSSRTSP